MLFSRRILVRLIGEVLMALAKWVLTSPLSSVQQYLLVLGKVMVVNTKSDQQRAEDDLYTVLRFKGKGDFERRIRELLVNDYKKLKKPLSKLLGKLESKIRTDKENNQAARNVYDQIKKSKTNEDKLSNLLNFKKQLKAFLKNQDDRGIVLNAIDSASVSPVIEVDVVHPKESEIKKFKKAQPLTSNRQDFEDALRYIESQEKVMGITLEKLREYKQHSVKIFLLNRVNSCKNGHSQLHPDVKEAIAILSNDKLRAFYDEEVKKKTLQPILSYKECEQLYDKINYEKNESHIVIERGELMENVEKVMNKHCFTSGSSKNAQESVTSPTEISVCQRQEQVASSNNETLGNRDAISDSSIIESIFNDTGISADLNEDRIYTSTPTKKGNRILTDKDSTDQEGFDGLSIIEEVLCDSSRACHKNESKGNSKDLLQEIHELKVALKIKEEINCFLKQANLRLTEEKLQFVEEKKDLLNRNSILENKLFNVSKERTENVSRFGEITQSSDECSWKLESEQGLTQRIDELGRAVNELILANITQEGLINIKQGYSRRASSPSQPPEQFKAVKSQFSEASAHGRKQIIYASASLILSGAFAVGTSLTMSHLGISIALALTALTFLTLGCYCSYKASTTLRNIELDQTFKMANHEAVFMVPSL
ncbi:TomO hydrophobic C-terminal domain-containing protein [Wolbachia endosymbiont of Cardiocondyla obscurior]|uniref:TomO hydrophobic C-terminal domain-containing protein n=1 Tax=Wolbachia endosymbiont of Cardiocondyla obscurior TaxID=2687307 RepID=UPI00157BA42D|nr:hypothetical protein [Wolbachia endosymbiont of Cardiocondyla obscurior]